MIFLLYIYNLQELKKRNITINKLLINKIRIMLKKTINGIIHDYYI